MPNKKELTIMIDFAHTPESLENILTAVKAYTKGKVISVFGCGGDRDRKQETNNGRDIWKSGRFYNSNIR